MATALKNLSDYNSNEVPDASKMTFGIVTAEWNDNVTFALRDGCINTLLQHGAKEENISLTMVPGAYELPLGAQILYEQKKPDAIICIGCVIQGETKHNDYINTAVANGLMDLNLKYNMPFVFGVLTPNTLEQALDRAGGKHGNKGVEAAITAIKMANL